MKKLLLSLVVLLATLGAWAQTQITDAAALANDKAYSVFTARGGWAVDAYGTKFQSTNDLGMGLTANFGNIQQAFSFKTIDSKIYLYSIYAEKYVNNNATLSETPLHDITLLPQVGGFFVIKFDDSHYINLGGSKQMIIDGWSTADEGNKVTITDITETTEYIQGLVDTEIQKAREGLDAAIVNAEKFLTYDETPITLSESNVSCNDPEPLSNEGIIGNLFDGDPATYFHTRWSGSDKSVHYLEIALAEDIEQFKFNTTNRNVSANIPATYRIEGSNNGTDFTEIAIVNSTAKTAGAEFNSNAVGKEGTAYRYLRFNVIDCYTSYNIFWHLAEFSLNKAVLQDTDSNEQWMTAINEAKSVYNNPESTAESLRAATQKLENPDWLTPMTVKYSFKYNGEEKYTQEMENVLPGSNYPDISVTLPFGVYASKPAGHVTADNVVDGVKTVEIELTINLPFVPAADYASISNWYYLSIYEKPVYYQDGQTAIELSAGDIPVDNKDAYTWAFVGDIFDGNYMLYNLATGSTKILSSTTSTDDGNTGANTHPLLTETPVPDGNNTYWTPTNSTNATNGFYLAQKGFPNNRMNVRNDKLAYWTGGADVGSTFTVKERNFAITADLEELVAKASAINYGTTVGYYTQASVEELKAAIDEANAAIGGEPTQDEVNALELKITNAVAALKIVLPEKDKFYNIVSANTSYAAGKQIYVSDDAGLKFDTPTGKNIGNVFQFVPVEDQEDQFYVYNVERGLYISTNKAHANGQQKAEFAITNLAKPITIANMGSENIVKLTPVGGAMIHAQQANSVVVAWDNNDYKSASAWKIVEVEDMTTQLHTLKVGELGYSTIYLAYDAVIPAFEGDNGVYVAEQVNAEGTAMNLKKIEGVLPANTGAIVKAPQGEYEFAYSEAAGTETSMLKGSTYDKNIVATANKNHYILSHEEGEVAFFKTTTSVLELDGEYVNIFFNHAFKAYLPIEQGSAARSLVFNFGGETGIHDIESGDLNGGNAEIYDLSGRRVQKAQKGLYIINGKKVVR